MVDVSVVVSTSNSRGVLSGLFDSLDRQSLAVSEFEVVVVDRDSSDQTVDLLGKLSARRPNVRWVGQSETDQELLGLELCSGEYVLHLDPEARLFPEALERLTQWARTHDLDAVAGRAATASAAVPEVLLQDSASVEPAKLPEALAAPALLLRRPVATNPTAVSLAAVGVLGSYPVLARPHGGGGDQPATSLLVQEQVAASWHEGRLRVEVAGSLLAGVAPEVAPASTPTVTALVRSATSSLSYVVPVQAQTAPADGPGPASWTATIDLDVATAALGEPLPHDTWELDLQLSGPGVPPHRSLTVGASACPAALLPLGPVVVAQVDGRLQVDVGPTRHPLVADADPAWGTITETAAGTLLVLQLPEVSVVPEAPELEGYLALGTFRLRSWVSNDGKRAWLRAYLSGLAGVTPVNAMFGDVSAKPTGLELTISEVGQMTLARPTPQPAPKPAAPKPTAAKPAGAKPAAKKPATNKPAAKKPAAKKPAAKEPPAKKPTGPVATLRRAIPAPLEPAIRRLAAVPAARDWYRRLTKL